MNSNKKTAGILEDVKINIKIKLSVLWATVMFLFIYVDIFGNFKPGVLEDIMSGEVAGMQINHVWLLGATIMMSIPALMVFLSMALKPKINRWVNIIVATLFIVIGLGSLFIDVPWVFYVYGTMLEIVLLLLIIRYAWKWPKPNLGDLK